MATIDYPTGLPLPLRSGYGLQHVSPLMRSDLQSGRARQRRRYTSVPTMVNVSWLMDTLQARAFESWFRDSIVDGAEWFNIRLSTPMGLSDVECRFVEMYSGPEMIGRDHWQISAQLETRERQLMPAGWGLVPSFITGADIFDRAMNQEWPAA